MFQPPLCKNDRCGALVPPSKNPGVQRKFCSNRCRLRYHARMQYAREMGYGGSVILHDGIGWFNRIIARSAKTARKRLEEHNNDCPFSKNHDGLCPAMFDPYDRKKLCLIHAVLNEDWSQLMAAEEGQGFDRTITSRDGHWMHDVEGRSAGKEVIGHPVLSDEERDAMIAAGVASPS